jgi:hypothetical protein
MRQPRDCSHCGVYPASLRFHSCEPKVLAMILGRQILRCKTERLPSLSEPERRTNVETTLCEQLVQALAA